MWIVIALLAVIVALLLFGRLAVIGAAGAVAEQLGGMLLLAFLIGASLWFDVHPLAALVLFFAGLGVIIAVLKIVEALQAPPVVRDSGDRDLAGSYHAPAAPPRPRVSRRPPSPPPPLTLGGATRPPLASEETLRQRRREEIEAYIVRTRAESERRREEVEDEDEERVVVRDGLRKRVSLHYRDAEGTTTERTVRLQRITTFRGTPYLEGYCELRREYRRFRLERCEEIADLVSGEVWTPQELADELGLDLV